MHFIENLKAIFTNFLETSSFLKSYSIITQPTQDMEDHAIFNVVHAYCSADTQGLLDTMSLGTLAVQTLMNHCAKVTSKDTI